MNVVRTMLTCLFVLGATAAAAAADRCLNSNEQRVKAAAHAVIPLSRAMRALRAHGEVIHARLCEHGGRLVYVLTVLGRDGKVAEAGVDAGNGSVVALREAEKPDKAEKQDKSEKQDRPEKQDRADKQDKQEKKDK